MNYIIKRKKLFLVLLLIVLFIVAYTKISQQVEIKKLNQMKAKYNADIERLKLLKENLEEELKNIDNSDVQYLEKQARQKRRLIKPGEIIYVITE